jgi:hypothetical protein
VGHTLNLAGVVCILLLLFYCTREIAGTRAALLSTLLYSGMGALPILVGWVSGIQDILAICFVLGALLAELRGRGGLALTLTVGALLSSKETTLALIPALIAAGQFRGASGRTVLRSTFLYATIVILWGITHPAIQILMSGSTLSGSPQGLMVTAQDVGRSLIRGAVAVFNLPLGKPAVESLRTLLPTSVAALAISVVACYWIMRKAAPTHCGPRRVLLLSALMGRAREFVEDVDQQCCGFSAPGSGTRGPPAPRNVASRHPGAYPTRGARLLPDG